MDLDGFVKTGRCEICGREFYREVLPPLMRCRFCTGCILTACEERKTVVDVIDKLSVKVREWLHEACFLTGEDDSVEDKMVGENYINCAREIYAIIKPFKR